MVSACSLISGFSSSSAAPSGRPSQNRPNQENRVNLHLMTRMMSSKFWKYPSLGKSSYKFLIWYLSLLQEVPWLVFIFFNDNKIRLPTLQYVVSCEGEKSNSEEWDDLVYLIDQVHQNIYNTTYNSHFVHKF